MHMPVIIWREPKVYPLIDGKTSDYSMLVVNMRPYRTYTIWSEYVIFVNS